MLNIPLRERLATSKKNLENPMQSSSVLSPDTDFITVERDAFSVATSTSAANLFTASTKSDSINAYDCSTDKGNDSSRRTRAYTDIGTTSEEGSSDTHAYTESSTIRGKSSVSSRSRSPVSKQSLHKEDFGEGQTSANNGAIFSVFVHAANKTYPKPLKPIRSKSSDTQKNADSAATQITSTSPAEIEPLKVTLDSGSYDIWMVIDNREIFGKKDRGYLQEKLAKNGVKCIVRAMQLGDFTWVAKEKRTIDEAVNTMSVEQPKEQDREIMLGYLGERKRMDDLCASVMDGRFVEQMSRLKKCHVSRCMYLIENYGKMDKLTLSQAALESSIARIQVHSGMQVTRTDNIEHTVRYLTYFTKYLMDLYKDKAVTSDPAVEVSESTVGGLVVSLMSISKFRKDRKSP
ncbi:hypothetical protein SARC_02589 [Sphaeroforma arctica JP610]|uniref:Crossover junction endonuclease MUS81 n=1 Tax=Sphaeroforma arctica JP610 TaxID=667725 RepID=A0A0L0G8K5_9EUKA|nr:hypothetical protein SARC_02589 [Sphaeroforma arctica JP610]KNC85211.1 hypothetical protein SARC_02589 [Sphaeroforma arctica JP610]|eukprot:XP_014159113.1 hypothetical protein SARC_02589 [Sphaeroforma arctica JP610]